MMSLPEISLVLLVLLLAAAFVAAVALIERRSGIPYSRSRKRITLTASVILVWLTVAGLAARMGLLLDFDSFPPPALRILGPSFVLVFFVAFSSLGAQMADGLTFSELIGFQAFRLPVELILYGFFVEGKIPVEMTFDGRNFDVLTAISAIALAPLVARGTLGRRTIWIWNAAGLALLLNVLSIAVLSVPGKLNFLKTDPPNSLPFYWPSIWIIFCVMLAVVSHLIIFRKLTRTR